MTTTDSVAAAAGPAASQPSAASNTAVCARFKAGAPARAGNAW